MSLYTNSLVLSLRNFGRIIGANKWVASILSKGGYETSYDDAFFKEIRPGDRIWDVGANVGYYTQRFSEKVGKGAVLAFEPSPINYKRLLESCASLENVTLLPCALGLENGNLVMQQGEDSLGATSRIVDADSGGIEIEVRSAADLIETSQADMPNGIKIDVEGFELEVLQGLGSHLNDDQLRYIGIEVHFGILKQRDMPNAPQKIEGLLKNSGFSITWPDNSHLIAIRSSK